MTICKELKRAEKQNGETVTAWETQDKFSSAKRYEVTVSRDSMEIYTVKCARTTWKKCFNEQL